MINNLTKSHANYTRFFCTEERTDIVWSEINDTPWATSVTYIFG